MSTVVICRDCKKDEKSCTLPHASVERENEATLAIRMGKLRFSCTDCGLECLELKDDFKLEPNAESFSFFSVSANCFVCQNEEARARPKFVCAERGCRGSSNPIDVVYAEEASRCLVCSIGEENDVEPGSFLVCFSRCACKICLDCAPSSLVSMLDNKALITTPDGYTSLGCPSGHPGSVLLQRHTVKLGGDRQSSRLKQFQSEDYIGRTHGFKFCPNIQCREMISGPFESDQITCPFCSHTFENRNPQAPEAASSGDAQSEDSGNAKSEDSAFVDPLHHQNCPFCDTMITHLKHDGCHHIGYGIGGCPGINQSTGQRCGKHWCYVCLAEWKDPDNARCKQDHWFCSPSCNCSVAPAQDEE